MARVGLAMALKGFTCLVAAGSGGLGFDVLHSA